MPHGRVWIFLEGASAAALWSLVGMGRNLADRRGVELGAVLLGACSRTMQALALEAFCYGVDTVHMVEAPILADYERESWTGALAGLIERYRPGTVLLGGSAVAQDLADNLSAALGVEPCHDMAELEGALPGEAALIACAVRPAAPLPPTRQPGRTGHIILEPLWGTVVPGE